jgi:hypothetical protein
VRAYFALCLALGRLLGSMKYAKVRIVSCENGCEVRKRRSLYAPLLIWISAPFVGILDAGVRFLPQRDWEQRERRLYRSLYDTPIRIEAGRTLVLPCLPGRTLAALLEDPALEGSARTNAIEHAVVALVELHELGRTHGDAMADNVMIDLEAGVARWFDFETIHDASRSIEWRRADDVRALLATCLLRTRPGNRDQTLELILDVYANDEVARLVESSFTSPWRRSLGYHLSQAALSFDSFREIARLLRQRHGR